MENEASDGRFAALRGVRLSPEEKSAMRGSIIRRIRASEATMPVPAGGLPVWFSAFRQPRFAFSAMAAVFIAISGSVSFAAASSLPGDSLYPVKVGVNERISGAFQMTPESRASWEEELVSRRVGEADALASVGRLGDDERRVLESLLNGYAEEEGFSGGDDIKRKAGHLVELEMETENGKARYRIRVRSDDGPDRSEYRGRSDNDSDDREEEAGDDRDVEEDAFSGSGSDGAGGGPDDRRDDSEQTSLRSDAVRSDDRSRESGSDPKDEGDSSGKDDDRDEVSEDSDNSGSDDKDDDEDNSGKNEDDADN